MNRRYILLTVTFLLAMCSIAQPALARTVRVFVRVASEANLFEIESSKLALEKSRSDVIKAFAQQMVDDHTVAGENLAKAVAESDVDSKHVEETLSMSHLQAMEKLRGLEGAAFDREYVKVQATAHKQAVILYMDYAKYGTDRPLREFADKTLPTLREHKDSVMKLKAAR